MIVINLRLRQLEPKEIIQFGDFHSYDGGNTVDTTIDSKSYGLTPDNFPAEQSFWRPAASGTIVNRSPLRETIINLLDDENGISEPGYFGLKDICIQNAWTDITDVIQSSKGSYFLLEGDAEELRKVSIY